MTRSSLLSQLRVLSLNSNRIGDEGVRVLAASPFLKQLHTLDLSGNNLSDEGAGVLADSSAFPLLRHLYLGGHASSSNQMTFRGLEAIINARNRQNLLTLHLDWQDMDDNVGLVFKKRCAYPSLRILNIGFNEIGPGSLPPLLESSLMESLTQLDLSGNPLGLEGIIQLAREPMPQLHSLRLHNCQIDLECVKVLGCASERSGLRSLTLSFNRQLGDEAIQTLARSETLSGLVNLDLDGLGSTLPVGNCLHALAHSKSLIQLRELGLGYTNLPENGLLQLADSPLAGRLTHLRLRGCYLPDEQLIIFQDRSRWPELVFLDLDEIPLKKETRHQLQACWGEAILLDSEEQEEE